MYVLFVYYFACRYYSLNYIIEAQALGFLMSQDQPKPNSSPQMGWAGVGQALGLAQHITICGARLLRRRSSM